MPQPAVAAWRGPRISFDRATVYESDERGLVSALRRAKRASEGRPTAIDLFCGAGGLSLGLKRAGYGLLLGTDADAVACETHANAFPGVTVRADLSRPRPLIEKLYAAGIRQVDLVAGGPPCQPFSRAGSSKIRSLSEQDRDRAPDARPRLWLGFMAFVRAFRPHAVLLENVPDMACWDGGQTLRSICGSLEHEGYEVQARVLKCWEFGVPQHRQRLFVVGTAEAGTFEWPEADPDTASLASAISDLPTVGPAQRDYWLPLRKAPKSDLQRSLRSGRAKRISDHITRDLRSDDAKAFGLLKSGKTYAELPKQLRRYRADIFDDKYNILKWREPARSITAHIAKDGYWYIHPDAKRMLSIREAARVQTFPDSFRFAGHPSDRLRQIGNAVPPLLARRLAGALMSDLETSEADLPVFTASNFRRKLLAWHNRAGFDFPWRRKMSPWLVLATEILLRRTRADAVASVWKEFAKRYPTPQHVLRDRKGVKELLWPLGLRWRVENLLAVARVLVRDWDGEIPDQRKDLEALPGVGAYVADAVLAFAFGHRAVLVDSNTTRIASRIFGLPETWTSHRNLDLRASVARLGGVRAPTPAVNLALIDLGRTVCLPGKPKCDQCPVRNFCRFGSTSAS